MTTIAQRQRGRAGLALLAVGAMLLSIAAITLVAKPAEATFGGGGDFCADGTVHVIPKSGGSAGGASVSVQSAWAFIWTSYDAAKTFWRVSSVSGPDGTTARVVRWIGSPEEVTSTPSDGYLTVNVRHIEVCIPDEPVFEDWCVPDGEGGFTLESIEVGEEVPEGSVEPGFEGLDEDCNERVFEDWCVPDGEGGYTLVSFEVDVDEVPEDAVEPATEGLDDECNEVPEDTTTTTEAGDTTTTTEVAGPDDSELPDTGAGTLLALLGGGLGMLLMGGGSLALASRRRQAIE